LAPLLTVCSSQSSWAEPPRNRVQLVAPAPSPRRGQLRPASVPGRSRNPRGGRERLAGKGRTIRAHDATARPGRRLPASRERLPTGRRSLMSFRKNDSPGATRCGAGRHGVVRGRAPGPFLANAEHEPERVLSRPPQHRRLDQLPFRWQGHLHRRPCGSVRRDDQASYRPKPKPVRTVKGDPHELISHSPAHPGRQRLRLPGASGGLTSS
jgi:hypothetical protein